MAFKQPGNSDNNNQDWKAEAFLNAYLPTPDGRAKISGTPLRTSREREKQLIEWLRKDPEGNCKKLAGNGMFIYEFVEVGDATSNALVLD